MSPDPPFTAVTDSSVPTIVLDTNVVFDCFLFRNAGCAPLLAALSAGRLRWIAAPSMRAELDHVLARGALPAWQAHEPALRVGWERFCAVLPCREAAASGQPHHGLRCTDPDDQKFIDFALATGARWLLSRDRAVLKLARRGLPLGLSIMTPERWAATGSACAGARQHAGAPAT